MKIARFQHDNKVEYGIIEDGLVRVIDGPIFEDNIRLSDIYISTDEIRLLAPVFPSKVVCVGLNYKDHAEELGIPIPDEPIIFLKPPTSIIGPGENIFYPAGIGRLDYEAELALVIKKISRDVSTENARERILGYTCLNDVTARDLQKKDGQWTRAKSFDTFCPIGPYICSNIDPDNADIKLLVNNEVRQSSATNDLIFPVDFLVSFISRIMTLLPGDVIATGTPGGVGPLSRGDEVEVNISAIGSLKNRVV